MTEIWYQDERYEMSHSMAMFIFLYSFRFFQKTQNHFCLSFIGQISSLISKAKVTTFAMLVKYDHV